MVVTGISTSFGGNLSVLQKSQKAGLNMLWAQLDVVPVTTALILAAGDLAAADRFLASDQGMLAVADALTAEVFVPSLGRALPAALFSWMAAPLATLVPLPAPVAPGMSALPAPSSGRAPKRSPSRSAHLQSSPRVAQRLESFCQSAK